MNKNEPLWRRLERISYYRPPTELRFWLKDSASLTRRLRGLCKTSFRVNVLSQQWCRPLRSERIALGLADREVSMLRQVQLLCDGSPWVFARTIIPRHTLQGRSRWLANLGSKPLGEVLFKHPSMQRQPVEVAAIQSSQVLFHDAVGMAVEAPGEIWGRRSVFTINNRSLLVSEIFLPAMQDALRS